MSVITALAPAAGLLTGLVALAVDHAVSVKQAGRASWTSLTIAAVLGLGAGLAAWWTLTDPVFTGAAMAATSALAVAVSTDLRFGLLADLTSLIIALCALMAAQVLTPHLTYLDMAVSAALAAGILGLAGLYGRLRRGQMGLGSGDILLASALALWCVPVTAAIGVALGAGLTLLMALFLRARADARLPFGPGLAAGFLLAIILEKLT